jgi:hypothetical protein
MMTSGAKSWLKKTVRGLRERLLQDLRDGVDSRYKWAIKRGDAVLDEANRKKRARLEEWLNGQVRTAPRGAKESDQETRERFLNEAIKLHAATFLNRLVVVRQMETLGLVQTRVLTGGWGSSGFKSFRELAPEAKTLESEGYPFLCRLIFDELSGPLPDLFAPAPLESLFTFSTTMWRDVVKTLDAEDLSADERQGLWEDDTLLGWVYQFWNDPDREALDLKIKEGGKIENHEIAAKTQLFTDRYMVEWLLQNSLGQFWLSLCRRNGWTAEVVSSGTQATLEKRREEFRGQRERGEVSLEQLMRIESALEERWKYWVPRELPEDGADQVPASLREMKLLDPACGSGHFLVIAFDLLAALYEEEARHRGEYWTSDQIAQWILERNLHGMDIDGRAVQIAGAALWLKLKRFSPTAKARANLVSTDFGLSTLSGDEPEVLEFFRALEEETGLPESFLRELLSSLKNAEHLGSLLRVDKLLKQAEKILAGTLFDGGDVREVLDRRLGQFVEKHAYDSGTSARICGRGLVKLADYVRLNREGAYDLVVGNPPYQNRGKMNEAKYIEKQFSHGKADLYSAFLLRGLELVKPGGMSSLLTLRGWMFLGTFADLRQHLLKTQQLTLLGDLDRGAFEDILDEVVSVAISCFRKAAPRPDLSSVAQLPTPRENTDRDNRRTFRKMAALLAGVGRYEFHPDQLAVVPEQPLVYWWNEEFLKKYSSLPSFGDVNPGKMGANTGDNPRFLRLQWEVHPSRLSAVRPAHKPDFTRPWQPFIKGAAGTVWYEPLSYVAAWKNFGMEMKINVLRKFGPNTIGWKIANEHLYFQQGVAFAMIGASFTARLHRFRSIFGNMGSSVFPRNLEETLCLLNSEKARFVLNSLNPGNHYEVGDVNRLPLAAIEAADQIVAQLDIAFTQHEQARETSVEFVEPGPSAWESAQEWAQTAVDRPDGAPLPPYHPLLVEPTPADHLSYALGLALGRFLPPDQIPAQPARDNAVISAIARNQSIASALPNGILFLNEAGDSLDHLACEHLRQVWHEKPLARRDLREYLKTEFFKEVHLDRYCVKDASKKPLVKRPIYFPLSSANKTFVAYLSIHRWTSKTLEHLLADHLQPELHRLGGELNDLAELRHQGDIKSQGAAQGRYDQVLKRLQELQDFASMVREIAEKGAPPADPRSTPREVDAPFEMNLDDGVMINSAALWPLLEPQWKDPRKWWKELCEAKGKKDYDWAHLAQRYFPTRVDQKCQSDPSLAVAHGVFWKYHPAKAYEWELRLQSPDELGSTFKLDEPNSDQFHQQFEANHPDKVRELRENEEKRRTKKSAKAEKAPRAGQQQEQLELEI